MYQFRRWTMIEWQRERERKSGKKWRATKMQSKKWRTFFEVVCWQQHQLLLLKLKISRCATGIMFGYMIQVHLYIGKERKWKIHFTRIEMKENKNEKILSVFFFCFVFCAWFRHLVLWKRVLMLTAPLTLFEFQFFWNCTSGRESETEISFGQCFAICWFFLHAILYHRVLFAWMSCARSIFLSEQQL